MNLCGHSDEDQTENLKEDMGPLRGNVPTNHRNVDASRLSNRHSANWMALIFHDEIPINLCSSLF